MQFGTWLRDARAQEKDRGISHRDLACDARKLTPYVQDRMARALQGLEELYAQLPSVAAPEEAQRAQWEEGRRAFIVRTREALDLLGATLTAVGCTEEELESILDDDPDPETDQEPAPDPDEPSGEPEERVEPDVEETVQLPLVPVALALAKLPEKTGK